MITRTDKGCKVAFWVDGHCSVRPGVFPPTLLTHPPSSQKQQEAQSSFNVPLVPSTEKVQHHTHCKGERLRGMPFHPFAQNVLKGKSGAER